MWWKISTFGPILKEKKKPYVQSHLRTAPVSVQVNLYGDGHHVQPVAPGCILFWGHSCAVDAVPSMPGVDLMVRVVGFRSEGPEFKSCSAVELIPGGVNSACHPSEVSKMSASMLVCCVGVATRPGLCPIAKETA